MVRLVKEIVCARARARQWLQETMIDLIAAGLVSVSQKSIELLQPEVQTVLRAKAFVYDNFSYPELNRQLITRHVELSLFND